MNLLAKVIPESIGFQFVAIYLIGVLSGFLLVRWRQRQSASDIAHKERNLLENAQNQAGTVIREARLAANEEALKLRNDAEKLFSERRRELAATEKRLIEREALLNQQLENVVHQEKHLRQKIADNDKHTEAVETLRKDLNLLEQQRRDELKKICNLNEAEVRAAYLREIQQDAMKDASTLAKRVLDEAKTHAEEKARRIVSVAIQRYAGEHAFETSTATVALPNEELKGRIIGREGRNIRAFEASTGVTVLIDDTPNAVVLSGFDPVRREIAREAMERLLLDGRIHPTRIEEVVAKVSQEMDEAIFRAGEEAVMKVGISPTHVEITKLLGRLKFRHSYSQNILSHSIEVAHIMGLMASELGIDVSSAKRAGLLHDIGKALDHEIEGPHAIIGADFIRRFGESDNVVNGVAGHHDEVAATCLLPILVSAADAISASRPGARSETMMTYIKRVDDLEKIALAFEGVEKCFAVHAGRELRVIVHPDKVNDEQAYMLARNIARTIEEKLQYPGQIRITVLRETRVIEFAK